MSKITSWSDINQDMNGLVMNRITKIVQVLLNDFALNGEDTYIMRLWVLSEVIDTLPEDNTQAGKLLVKMVQIEKYE